MKLIIGGVRSGKSEFAEKLALSAKNVLYVATSKNDFGMESRIEAHKKRRPASWGTLEKYRDFTRGDFEGFAVALFDCAGVMATNIMFETDNLENLGEQELFGIIWGQFRGLLDSAASAKAELLIVSNEVGSGLVSEHRIGNQFRDLLGGINKALAAEADEVYFMVAGIPMKIKG